MCTHMYIYIQIHMYINTHKDIEQMAAIVNVEEGCLGSQHFTLSVFGAEASL